MSTFYGKGTYRVRFTSQGFVKAKTGTMQFVLKFMVFATEDDEPVSHEYERSMFRAMTEKTVEYLAADLAQLGYSGDRWSLLDPSTPNFHDFAGLEFILYCNHEAGQDGQMREKWGFPRVSKAIDPMEGSELRRLDNLFGKQLRSATKAVAKPQAIRQPQPVVSTIADLDDIPF